jgi:rhodanese-related sulfurtransferase
MSLISRLLGVPDISPADLQRQLHSGTGVAVFDVSRHPSWLKGHVPGAAYLDPADFTESKLPSDKRTPLVFYCSGTTCGAGPYAARRAKQMGYENVSVMARGISGWVAAGLPTEPGDAQEHPSG